MNDYSAALGREPNVAPVRLATTSAIDEDIVLLAFERHQRELIRFAHRMTRDVNAADDIVQEAFLRLVLEIAKAGEPTNVRAWLYRVCANLAVSRARRRNVVQRLKQFPGPSNAPAADAETMRHELGTAIHEALSGVSPAARAALLLAADGFSGREIAETIGRSELATRALMYRARGRLRIQLSGAGAWA